MKKKNFIKYLLFSIIAFVSATLLSYAYFEKSLTDNTGTEVSFESDATSTILIHNAEELVLYGTDRTYNNPSIISEASTRKTLVLANDLLLKTDVLITADCDIDLNGHILDLNGNTLTIKHNYLGVTLFCNGSVTAPFETDEDMFTVNSSSRLVVSTPNSMVVIDGVIPMAGLENDPVSVAYDEDFSWYEIKEVNDNVVAYNALKMINTVLSDGYDDNRIYYDMESLDDITYLSSHFHSDIDLPYHFYNYDDLKITYSTNNSPYLTAYGQVTVPAVGTVANVVLTATVTYKSATVTKDFPITIINKNDSLNWAKVGTELIEEHLEPFAVYDNDVFQYYYVDGSLHIPYSNSYFGGTYFYETIDEDDQVIFDSEESSSHFLPLDLEDSGYIFTVGENVRHLRVTCTVGASSYTAVLDVEGEGNAYILNNYIYAVTIAKELYGDKIVVTKAKDGEASLNGYSIQELYTDVSAYTAQKVTALNYELLNNMDYTYEIGNIADVKSLFVSANRQADPNAVQSVFLNVLFSFSTAPYTVEIKIPVVFEDADIDDENRFRPYYNYFNTQFVNTTDSYTYKSFTMPFSYGSTYPIYYFDIVDEENNMLNNNAGQLIQDGRVIVNQTLSYSNPYTHETVNYTYSQVLNMNSDMLATIILSGTAKWNITINTNNLSKEDTHIFFRYRYRMFKEETLWFGSGSLMTESGANEPVYLSELIIPGIVRRESGGIPDLHLYERLFEIYHPNEEYVDGSTFIIFSRLSQEVLEIDFSNNASASSSTRIASFEGINYLTGVRRLLMQNALYNITSQTTKQNKRTQTLISMGYIKDMKGLEYLDLADNCLADFNSDNRNMPTGTNNYFIKTLSSLDNLVELHLENRDNNIANNNTIYQFQGIDLFANLESAYIYGNAFTCTYYSGWVERLNTTYTRILTSMYGSTGAVNQTVFTEASSLGITIYNTIVNDIPTEFTPDTSSSDYINLLNLRGIEYQDKLATGISISRVYEGFSSAPESYGIVDPEDIDGEVTLYFESHTISFEPVLEEGETEYTTCIFQIVYTITYRYTSRGTWSSTTEHVDVPITFEFAIERT